MVQDDIGPEPERYYDWMIWKLRQSKNMISTLQAAFDLVKNN